LPHLVTPLPGPNSAKVIERDRAVLSPACTRAYPLVVKHARGAIVEDPDGNRFLDFNAGIAVAATGHCHPRIQRAIREQAGKFIHMSGADFYYENMVELAEKLAKLAPGGREEGQRVYFGNSGTEAVEAAMKLARHHTGRQNFIAFFGAFHGRTLGALSLTSSKSVQRKGFGPLVPGVTHIPYADCYRCAYGKQPATCAVECVKVIEERVFRHTTPPEEVAAVFVEPVQGEGGYIVPPKRFFDELQDVCRRHGILLVADEVQSGMGRTGRMFASEHFDMVPDILVLAKGIASGMPLSAMVARRSIMDWGPGAHASTFGGNPVAVSAALETIQLLEESLLNNARTMGKRLLARMADWPARFQRVGEVRGLGLMIGFELVRDQATKEPAPEIRDRIVTLAFERGLLVLGAGRSTMRLCPPLVIRREQADYALDSLEECLRLAER